MSSTIFTSILLFFLMTLSGTLAHPTAYIYVSRDVTSATKAGLAWPNGDNVDIRQYESSKVSWYYTWSPSSTNTDLEFVPMLWGTKSVDQFSSSIQQTLAQGNIKGALGMNEPDQQGQSNLSPEDGAQMWKTYLEPLHQKGVRLGSPAPSSAPAGKTWLQNFLSTCNGGCTVDFIALHWYGTNASQFISYLQDYHTTFQRPLWVTEWACQNYVDTNAQCSEDDVVLFLNTTQAFMDSADFVERYAWFGAMEDMQGVNADNALMDSKGDINALGKQYIGTQTPQTSGTGSANGPSTTSGSGGSGGGIIFSAGSRVLPSLSLLSIALLLVLLS